MLYMIYHLQKNYHPIYEPMGGIPALEEVKFSIVGS